VIAVNFISVNVIVFDVIIFDVIVFDSDTNIAISMLYYYGIQSPEPGIMVSFNVSM
jgi:hypothetical protein